MEQESTLIESIRVTLAIKRRSHRWLAEQLGWSQIYLSRRMTGRTPLRVDDLLAIAAVLDVDPGELLTGRNWAA